VLPRGGTIPGRVADDYGDPVTRAVIFVARTVGGGARFERTIGGLTTDDHGRFRIYGLEPGEYVVGAEAQGMGGLPLDGESEGFVTTYYPFVVNEREGDRVRVTAGADSADVEIQLVRARTFRISDDRRRGGRNADDRSPAGDAVAARGWR
jgi:hypothetical protein